MKHLVMFSGGVGSWAAARRVVNVHGPDDMALVFADTLIEDADLYRFLGEAHADIGCELVHLKDGRTPWQVFHDVRLIGNTRIDPCSRVLKRELIRKWLDKTHDPADTIIYLGFDWTEGHRADRASKYWDPWRVKSPMTNEPYLSKAQMLESLADHGMAVPRLYLEGFPHNNCGGFCVKAGQTQFAHLLKMRRSVYLEHEAEEQAIRGYLDKDVSILRDRAGGGGRGDDNTKPLTMRDLRLQIEHGGRQMALYDWGGCGCFDTEGDTNAD